MEIRICIILLFNPYCIFAETEHYGVDIDTSSIIKELLAIIDILDSTNQTANEDKSLNIIQLGKKYGYPMQEHYVETEDGYVLTMFRIQKEGPIVFLMHGLLSSADDWVTAGPEHSLACLLASEGYDVWMGNARGNKHSRQHINISPEQPKFWDFSWDEIGRFDLPSMIDYILDNTGKENLAYIGHSQGTTSFFVMCSEKPEYNKKISTMIALSPVVYMSNIKSPLGRLVAPFSAFVNLMAKIHMFNEILPKPIDLIDTQTPICDIGNGIICLIILFLFCGFDFEQVNKNSLPIITSHTPAGASINQVIHYLQIISSGSFRKYDYGEVGNKKVYGSSSPPKYNIENVTAPVALFYSKNDWFSAVEDDIALKNDLPNVKDFYCVPFKKFNHIDFLWAKDIKSLVLERILKMLE